MLQGSGDGWTLFEISDRVDTMNQILGRLAWLERIGLDGFLPDSLADMVSPPSHRGD